MKKYLYLLILFMFAGSLIVSCNLFSSSEAEIIGYTSNDIIDYAVIDTENRKVVATVKPMDLSLFDPIITISENATITLPEAINDGIETTYVVTAENGNSVDWKITVNIQAGMSFTINETSYIFTKGFIDSTNPENNINIGNSISCIDKISNGSRGTAMEEDYDVSKTSGFPDFDYGYIETSATTVGAYTEQAFAFYDNSKAEQISFTTDYTISEYGDTGEYFKASFSGENSDGTVTVTNGFAKLLVIEDFPF